MFRHNTLSVDITQHAAIQSMCLCVLSVSCHRSATCCCLLHTKFSASPQGESSCNGIRVFPFLCNDAAGPPEILIRTKPLAADEVIVKFKGRVIFRQYIPKKRKRFGIKIYKLCDESNT